MKGSYWFILLIVLFLGVMFIVEYNLPKKFVWTPTFSRTDHQPFGCAVFDEFVIDSWPEDTYYSEETFLQLLEDTTKRWSILAIAAEMNLNKADVNSLLELAARGNKVLLASSSFGQLLSDTLKFELAGSSFSLSGLKKHAVAPFTRDSLFWVGDSAVYAPRVFEFYPQLCLPYFVQHDSLADVLALKNLSEAIFVEDNSPGMPETSKTSQTPETSKTPKAPKAPGTPQIAKTSKAPKTQCPVALSYSIGEGEMILVSTPLLFTNYGMLDKGNAAYLFRLLSRMSDLPLVRTEAYGAAAQEQQSPFRYFLSQPALRWGLYLTVITLVLFMIFTARRRQRPIPVIAKPTNKTLEFMELIGTLYYQKKNHADLVRKKFTYWAETLRRTIQVDVEDERNDSALCHKIATKTGMEEEKIQYLFRQLRPVFRGEREITEREMKEYIDEMNEITNHL